MELLKINQEWHLSYEHAAGATATYFFDQLKQRKVIVGKRCPKCTRVLLPPRAFCDRCFEPTAEWVEVGNRGVIESFTIVPRSAGKSDTPYVLAYVTLEGADCAVVNYVRNVDLSDLDRAIASLRVGARVHTRFAEPTVGRITDFWFELER